MQVYKITKLYTIILCTFTVDIHYNIVYNLLVRQGDKPLKKGSEEMNDLNVSEALLRAILELIKKCTTLDELRESVKRIIGE